MNFIHCPSVFWYILVRLLTACSSCVFLLMLRSESAAETEDLLMKTDYICLLKYIFMHSTGVLDIVDVYDCVMTSRVAVGDAEREDIDINRF